MEIIAALCFLVGFLLSLRGWEAIFYDRYSWKKHFLGVVGGALLLTAVFMESHVSIQNPEKRFLEIIEAIVFLSGFAVFMCCLTHMVPAWKKSKIREQKRMKMN